MTTENGGGGGGPRVSETVLTDSLGRPLRLSVSVFEDRVFVLATQLATFGTLLSATAGDHPDGTIEYSVRALLGSRDDAFAHLLARRLIEAL